MGASNLNAKLQVQVTVSFWTYSWYLPERKQHLFLLAWSLRLPWAQWPLDADRSCMLISQRARGVPSYITCLGFSLFLCKCPFIFLMTYAQPSLTKLTGTVSGDRCWFSWSSLELLINMLCGSQNNGNKMYWKCLLGPCGLRSMDGMAKLIFMRLFSVKY